MITLKFTFIIELSLLLNFLTSINKIQFIDLISENTTKYSIKTIAIKFNSKVDNLVKLEVLQSLNHVPNYKPQSFKCNFVQPRLYRINKFVKTFYHNF